MNNLTLLGREDTEALFDLLLESLPEMVLGLVASGDGIRSQQVASSILHWLPQTSRTPDARAWVEETLDWYVDRGDIEKSQSGRYYCIPPYAISARDGASTRDPRIFGDPRAQFALRVFGQGVDIESLSIDREPADTPEAARTSGKLPPIGIERSLNLPAGTDLEEFCRTHGLGLVNLELLAERLPRILEIVLPAPSELSPMPSAPGIWDLYNPRLHDYDRWVPTADWQSKHNVLVRWRPADQSQGHFYSRVFYYSGNYMGLELGTDLSRLWQLQLDAAAGSRRAAWSQGNHLWVPRILPITTRQWLQGYASQMPSIRGRWIILKADPSSIRTMRETLRGTLGFRSRTGSPPDQS